MYHEVQAVSAKARDAPDKTIWPATPPKPRQPSMEWPQPIARLGAQQYWGHALGQHLGRLCFDVVAVLQFGGAGSPILPLVRASSTDWPLLSILTRSALRAEAGRSAVLVCPSSFLPATPGLEGPGLSHPLSCGPTLPAKVMARSSSSSRAPSKCLPDLQCMIPCSESTTLIKELVLRIGQGRFGSGRDL